MASDTVPQMLDCIKVSVQSEEPRMPFPGQGSEFLVFVMAPFSDIFLACKIIKPF